jgi:hypothetical protein
MIKNVQFYEQTTGFYLSVYRYLIVQNSANLG